MFFNISRQHEQNYPCHYDLGRFCVSTDSGWREYENSSFITVYKGYADTARLNDAIEEIAKQDSPWLTGNFCAIVYNKQTQNIQIQTDIYRSFPVYVSTHGVTNLESSDRIVWSDSVLEIDSEFNCSTRKFNIIKKINESPIDEQELVEHVIDLLDSKTKSFLQHNDQQPIRVFLSGGVDSLLVYSFLQKHTKHYELVKCSHVDYDMFWLSNSHTITKNWGYTQIHHWIENCFLTSGAPGDEFTLRSPLAVNSFLRFYQLDPLKVMNQQWPNCLHQTYFTSPKNLKCFEQPALAVKTKAEFIWKMCNQVVNDWQHWHIGNTLTWTPLRDLEIYKLFLRLHPDAAQPQIFDSAISKKIIEHNGPGLTRLISDQKNSGPAMKNLCDFYFKNSQTNSQ